MAGDFSDNDQQVTHYDPQEQYEEQATDNTGGYEQDTENNEVQETSEDRNWRRMREENERYRNEAAEYKRKFEASRGDDELVEQRHLKEAMYRMQAETLELRLKNKFPDFDEIVNSNNLKKLSTDDPELAATIDATPDMYTKAVAAYKIIKSKQPVNYTEEDEQFDTNQFKPRSVNSLSRQESPLAGANAFQRGLSKDQKAKIFAEMQEAIKNRQ